MNLPQEKPSWYHSRNISQSSFILSFIIIRIAGTPVLVGRGPRSGASHLHPAPRPNLQEKPSLNSALRSPRPPHFRRKSCPPKRICVRRFSPSVCSSTCRSASGSLVSDVASKPLARGFTNAGNSFASQDLAKTSLWGACPVAKIGLSVHALSWPISHCVWMLLTSLVLRVGLHTAGGL